MCGAEPSWQVMWHGSIVEILSLKHRPSHWFLDMRQECRTFKSVTSHPCDWLLLIFAMRAQGAPLTKTDGKLMSSKAFWNETKAIQHSLIGRNHNEHV
jgi:hypothetical protein